MISFTDLGLEPTLLGVIVQQAAVILIACSVLLTVVKDLYEVRVKITGLAPSEIKVVIPALAGACADRLRVFVRLFSWTLAIVYVCLGVAVFLAEKGPRVPNGNLNMPIATIRSPAPAIWSGGSFTLQQVYICELFFHFIVVVTVAFIFFWMVGVRRRASNQRLRFQELT